jgi:hypothetical protein
MADQRFHSRIVDGRVLADGPNPAATERAALGLGGQLPGDSSGSHSRPVPDIHWRQLCR